MSGAASIGVVVLAAGAGKRMCSDLPKPLHKVAGLPMIEHVLRAASAISPRKTVVVASPALQALAADLPASPTSTYEFVTQDPPAGTGDAVRLALPLLDGCDLTIVLYADHPLVDGATLEQLVNRTAADQALVTVLTCVLDDAGPYGRIVRDEQNRPAGIVERRVDEPAARLGGCEINSGIMAVQTAWAAATLAQLPPNDQTGEYFLTDLVAAAANAASAEIWPISTVAGPAEVLIGVNDRVELATADAILRQRIRRRHMLAGVTLIGAETIYIDEDVAIGVDTEIRPHCVIRAGSQIGANCRIGPGATLDCAVIGDGVEIVSSSVVNSTIGADCHIGPYSHVKSGSQLESDVFIGNFAEIKNSYLKSGVRVGHFSYIGDTTMGEATNVGAGAVTCNFDGVDKHHTEIGKDVFIGSGSMLVAPLTIGDEARTGAGSVVTKDVQPGATVVGIPARAIRRRHASPAG